MHIHTIHIENWQGIDQFVAEPHGRSLLLLGSNAVGKSSVHRAIYYALTGKQLPERALRTDKSFGNIVVTLASGETAEIKVQMLLTETERKLIITDADGKKQTRAWLAERIGNILFDPYAFAGMEPREQIKWLREIARIPDDGEKTEKEKLAAVSACEADARAMQGVLARLRESVPAGKIPDPKEYEKLRKRLDKARPGWDAYIEISKKMHVLGMDNEQNKASVVRFSREIQDLQRQIDEKIALHNKLQDLVVEQDKEYRALEKKRETLTKNPDVKDYDKLQDEVTRLAATMQHLEVAKQIEATQEAYESKVKEAEKAKTALQEYRATIKKQISEALPDGVTFDIQTNSVFLEDIPLTETSINSARLIEFGVAMSERLSPGLRVIRIEHGSLLDRTTLESIIGHAEKAGYQLLVERVTDQGALSYEYIEHHARKEDPHAGVSSKPASKKGAKK